MLIYIVFIKKMEVYMKNKKQQIIYIDEEVVPTKIEEIEINKKLNDGYSIKRKSKARSMIMKKRAREDKWNKKAIIDYLQGDKKALDTFNAYLNNDLTNTKGNGGFFVAKAWFVKEYLPLKEKEKIEEKK